MKGKGGQKMKETKNMGKNPYATNRGGKIDAPNRENDLPKASVIRPSGDGRA